MKSEETVQATVVEPPLRTRARCYDVIGTELLATDYDSLVTDLISSWRKREPRTLSFCNTYMVTKRRHEAAYRAVTEVCDTNLPDGMPLVWCMNFRGARMRDRVYGPIFMHRFLMQSPPGIRHYFLGGDEDCLRRLCEAARRLNKDLQLVGSHHGYFREVDETSVLADVRENAPDVIWVGLGTPKQDEWVARHRLDFRQAILLPVGSSFEFVAGIKAPPAKIFQRLGLTWLFRMLAEPRRLCGRYFKYNTLFLCYLIHDLIRHRRGRGRPPW